MRKMAIFDCNGTLIDDSKEWWQCVTKTFETAGVPIPTTEEFVQAIEKCDSITAAYRFFGIKLPAEQIASLYLDTYTNLMEDIIPYQATQHILQILGKRGIVCALVTWHKETLLWQTLIKFGLDGYFSYIKTEVHDKASAIQELCALEGIEPRNCYYIGDMPSDIACSQRAGVKAVALLTEIVPSHLIEAKRPDYKISNLTELPQIIFG